jgi:hypothetical protein
MKDRKRKSRRTPEQRAESERIAHKLKERIAYHEAKLAEERQQGKRS